MPCTCYMQVHDIMYTIVHGVHMFDIVHEGCAKFYTRRMAGMGVLYYTNS